MDVSASIAIAAFAIAVCLIVYVYSLLRSFTINRGHSSFRRAVFWLMLILVFDIVLMSSESQAGPVWYWVASVSAALYFICQSVALYFWFRFTMEELSVFLRLKYVLLIAIPVFITIVFSVVSIFVPGLVFTIESDVHSYTRGGWGWWLVAVLGYLYLIASIVFLALNYRRMSRGSFVVTTLAYSMPVIALIMQTIFQFLEIIYPTVALALLIIFLVSILRNVQFDPLTGLNNRQQLEDFLYSYGSVSLRKRKDYLVGIMLDLNDFKSINDNYGHKAGDIALQEASRMIKQASLPGTFHSRYAGDEFVLILETNDPNDSECIRKRLKKEEESFNSHSKRPYKLVFAFGSLIIKRNEWTDTDSFLETVDRLMYEDKRRFHGQRGQ